MKKPKEEVRCDEWHDMTTMLTMVMTVKSMGNAGDCNNSNLFAIEGFDGGKEVC